MKYAIHWLKKTEEHIQLSQSMSVLPACNQQHVGK